MRRYVRTIKKGVTLIKEFKEWYLQIRAFEIQDNGKTYAKLGARIYKKWVPTSGEVITRLRGINRLKIVASGSRKKALENHKELTRIWEWRHFISAVALFLWAIGAGLLIGIEHFYTSIVINIFVNIYPIIVQRYNRIRISILVSKMH